MELKKWLSLIALLLTTLLLSILTVLTSNLEPKKIIQPRATTIKVNSYPPKNEQPEQPEQPEQLELILTGDVMLGRTVMTKSLDLGNPSYPFIKVANELRSADLVFINLENPIVDNCPRHIAGLKFCASNDMISGLVYAGVDVVSMANNHFSDFGTEGVRQTKKNLETTGIKLTGIGELAVIKVNQINFGFLGFNLVDRSLSGIEEALVNRSKDRVDVLVVGVHWGNEYQDRASQNQKEAAARLVELGTDILVGHHPHVVQETERIDNSYVYYSLGNFVFDQMWSEKTKKGLAVKLTFKGSTLLKEELMPVYMTSWAQPEFENFRLDSQF
jgi:poly-gamma-glutamate synthesis protein (capsule biosynthesis protein)